MPRPSLLPAATLVAALAVPVAYGAAHDWPQYRGPDRSGVGTATGLARSWPATGPTVVWKRPIGAGFSSVAVVDGRVYVGAAEGEREFALCLEATTGKELWRADLGPRFPQGDFGDGPRATPTVADGKVYAVGGFGILHALDAGSGKELWSVDLPKTYGADVPRFGYSPSPLVDGGLVLADAGGPEKSLVALDAGTGELKWSIAAGPAGYSSPVAVTLGGVKQYLITRLRSAELISLAPDGKELWRHAAPPGMYTLPIAVPGDRLFLSTYDEFGGQLLKVTRQGDAFKVEELWKNSRMRNQYNTSVVVGETLYGFDNATLKAISLATGEQVWAFRGFGKGSLIAADGMLYVLSDLGVLALVKADPAAYQEIARVQVLEGRTWTSPSIAGSRVFLRDHDEIVCVEVGS
ncbi:MAG TPA: PQQ-binding-like beta-propeller repeat protein [Thermoanaerobaculia bacterium]|nr:PQQ-binding-like beta-propeller repeat protein [Thermoanaerobaculia bacterium]